MEPGTTPQFVSTRLKRHDMPIRVWPRPLPATTARASEGSFVVHCRTNDTDRHAVACAAGCCGDSHVADRPVACLRRRPEHQCRPDAGRSCAGGAACRRNGAVHPGRCGNRPARLPADGQPGYLEPLNTARGRLDADLARLDGMLATFPEWAAPVGRIRSLAAEKLAELQRTIALHQSGQANAARDVVRGDEGRHLMVAARAETGWLE